MSKVTAAITAVHGVVPDKVLSNKDLEKMVDTNDEWITTRTGIKERRILEKGKPSSDLGAEILNELLKKTNTKPEELDLLVVGTITADHPFPSNANIICDKVGATNAWGFDLSAACSGFLYSLTVGSQFIETGKYKKVAVIGMDIMSSIIDYQDRATCIIFGDGGGGVMLEPNEDGYGVIDTIMRSNGEGRHYLYQKAGGSLHPPTEETVKNREHFVHQEGQAVFKHAVSNMADVSAEIMEKNELSDQDVDWLVPHQANLRIIDATARRMGLSSEKVMINIERYGNTTSGTIPLCLWEWDSKLKKGDNVILSAFGGGFTWGAIYLKWAYDGK